MGVRGCPAALGECLGVAVRASGRDLVASGDGVPRRLGPLDCALAGHAPREVTAYEHMFARSWGRCGGSSISLSSRPAWGGGWRTGLRYARERVERDFGSCPIASATVFEAAPRHTRGCLLLADEATRSTSPTTRSGEAGARRPAAARAALPRRLPVRAVDHDPAAAGPRFREGLRGFDPAGGAGSATRTWSGCSATPGSSAAGPDRGVDATRAPRSGSRRGETLSELLWSLAPPADPPPPVLRSRTCRRRRPGPRPLEGAQAPGLSLRRPDDRLCVHAVDGHRRRPPAGCFVRQAVEPSGSLRGGERVGARVRRRRASGGAARLAGLGGGAAPRVSGAGGDRPGPASYRAAGAKCEHALLRLERRVVLTARCS